MGYIGKDGKVYDTWGQRSEADARYDQHQEQKSLLEEQNRLIAQQNQINEKNRLNEMIAQYKQMEHEEEMRILNLCDDVGITKEAIDSFRDYLFTPPKELQKLKEDIDLKYYNLDEQIQDAKIYLSKDDELIINRYYEVFSRINKLKKILSEEQKIKIRTEFEEKIQNPNEYEKELKEMNIYDDVINEKNSSKCITGLIISSIILAVIYLVIFASANSSSSDDGLLVTVIILDIPTTIFWVYYVCKCKNLFKSGIRNESRKYIESKLDDLIYLETLKLNKIKPKEVLKNHIEEMEKDLNNFNANFTEYYNNTTNKWNDFIEFRKNHYNSKVEKLLIDVGIKETVLNLNLEYPKINVNNKIKDGSVEDYIAYFDELQN